MTCLGRQVDKTHDIQTLTNIIEPAAACTLPC